ELGYNYRLSNLLAAIGRAQLIKINKFIEKRRSIFEKYSKELSNIPGFKFMKEHKENISNRWLTTLTIDKKKTMVTPRDIINWLKLNNIEARHVWKPMHLQPLFKTAQYVSNNNDNSMSLFNDGICLPSGSDLREKEQERVIELILHLVKKHQRLNN
ncbi:MAG: DegT/DnrJ/EryC1/StrS family aminotransferase, partial [Candidatus Neomarinimicrobiota bacterium]